jgi:hypothetical protein
VGGLLHRERGRWRVVEYGAEAVETLKQRHPDMPDALLNRKNLFGERGSLNRGEF